MSIHSKDTTFRNLKFPAILILKIAKTQMLKRYIFWLDSCILKFGAKYYILWQLWCREMRRWSFSSARKPGVCFSWPPFWIIRDAEERGERQLTKRWRRRRGAGGAKRERFFLPSPSSLPRLLRSPARTLERRLKNPRWRPISERNGFSAMKPPVTACKQGTFGA